MAVSRLKKGIYAITDLAGGSSESMLLRTELLLRLGITMLQYRSQQTDREVLNREARQLKKLARKFCVPLIINNDVDLALRVGADGVHLGKDDLSVGEARVRLGRRSIIGCSCYNELRRAGDAVDAGADYLAFGSFFDSPSKPDAVRAKPELIRQAKEELNVFVVAIGGVTPENGPGLVAAGADMLAVISGLYAAVEPANTAKRYLNLFNKC